jgi:hypothetical protein
MDGGEDKQRLVRALRSGNTPNGGEQRCLLLLLDCTS